MKAGDAWIPGPPPGPGRYWVFWHLPSGAPVEAVELGPALICEGDPTAPLLIKMPGGMSYLYDPNRDNITYHMPIMPPGAPQ